MTEVRDPVVSPQSLREFFKSLLDDAIVNQRASVQIETSFYLVNLLADFLATEALFIRDENGGLERKPLAFLLKEALEEQGPARAQLLRRLGDTSLFVSGFFAESIPRTGVDARYYQAMGERAYDALGQVVARSGPPAAARRTLYEELAERFGTFVDLLAEVSDRTLSTTNAGLLRLYDRWMRSGSDRVGGLLRQQGVVALAPIKGRYAQ